MVHLITLSSTTHMIWGIIHVWSTNAAHTHSALMQWLRSTVVCFRCLVCKDGLLVWLESTGSQWWSRLGVSVAVDCVSVNVGVPLTKLTSQSLSLTLTHVTSTIALPFFQMYLFSSFLFQLWMFCFVYVFCFFKVSCFTANIVFVHS